jgi:uncharacterized repeat protein (TIGR03803 family)
LNIFAVGPRFGSTKLAAGAPHIRAFCECVGVCAIRSALTLAVLSALLLTLIAARPAQAQTETVLYNFCSQPNCSDGAGPQSNLTFDGAGNLYGTTIGGGLGYGTVFELSPNGSGGWNETVLHSFTGGADGSNPTYSGVIFDGGGNLYGTAWAGGAYGYGVVFELSPVGTSWTETVLYSFANAPDGAYPSGDLIMDPAGKVYGTTQAGGNCGGDTVFELSPSGGVWTEQVIYSECDVNAAGLTMDAAGNIFGDGQLTVFELSPNGNGGWNPTVIHTFTGPPKDGSNAQGAPVFNKAGTLYGTTTAGGIRNSGTIYKLSPVTKGKKKGTWTERIVHNFFNWRSRYDGSDPQAGIVFDAAGNIYGTTLSGGLWVDGTVYELVAPVGKGEYKEKILYRFDGLHGTYPDDSLILDSAGNLYGTTSEGGWYSAGVVFEVTP